jgi:hypothetical protein
LLKHTEGKGKEVEDFIRELAGIHKHNPGVKRPTDQPYKFNQKITDWEFGL